ncbi:hypothetical protein OIU77_011859 [Salix suchowensis]|uniref:Uncharacterized protein n=1 Tax=Salix suchowensis TaxID=1278906 RepID=A0ABQ9A247_9ROSI|nr:hypothetical protein OIU77_011859 [Salix suchowensis]
MATLSFKCDWFTGLVAMGGPQVLMEKDTRLLRLWKQYGCDGIVNFHFPSTVHRLMILMAAWRIIFIPSPQVSKGGSGFTDIPRTHTYPAVFRPTKRIS